MAVFYFKSDNRLAHRLGVGLSRDVAIQQAEANIESMRGEGIAEIDKLLVEIQTLSSRLADDQIAVGPLYDAANTLGGLAPVFGFPALGAAAFQTCEYFAFVEDGGTADPEAAKTLVSSLSILRDLDKNQTDSTDAIVGRLTKMVQHITSRGSRSKRTKRPKGL